MIMHGILLLLSLKSSGCYGNGNSQSVAQVGKLCVAGNTCAYFC